MPGNGFSIEEKSLRMKMLALDRFGFNRLKVLSSIKLSYDDIYILNSF